jgi:hypothetical protein
MIGRRRSERGRELKSAQQSSCTGFSQQGEDRLGARAARGLRCDECSLHRKAGECEARWGRPRPLGRLNLSGGGRAAGQVLARGCTARRGTVFCMLPWANAPICKCLQNLHSKAAQSRALAPLGKRTPGSTGAPVPALAAGRHPGPALASPASRPSCAAAAPPRRHSRLRWASSTRPRCRPRSPHRRSRAARPSG